MELVSPELEGYLVLEFASRRDTQVREGLGGFEAPRFGEEYLREVKPRRVAATWLRFAGVGANGLTEGSKLRSR